MRQVLPRHLGPRLRAKLQPVSAWAALLVAMRRRGRGTELWIGDSHAMSFNRDLQLSMFMRAPEGQLILRVGTRIMWSLSRKGFPPRVLRVARFVSWFGTRGALVPIFVTGEIDVRCHLAEREDQNFEFVGEYVSRCQAIAESFKAERLVVVVPPPPCEFTPNLEAFPIVGSLEQRVRAFEALRKAIVNEVSTVPGAQVLDSTDLLADENGVMKRELTDDGCHTNTTGIALVRGRVAELGLPN
ncbi:MAG: hypothetical protein ABIR57_06200 [Aeromicrobium sp.]